MTYDMILWLLLNLRPENVGTLPLPRGYSMPGTFIGPIAVWPGR